MERIESTGETLSSASTKTDNTLNNNDDDNNKKQKRPQIYSIKVNDEYKAPSATTATTKKSYVLIETTTNEDHALTVNLLKSRFPSASIFSSTESAPPAHDEQQSTDLDDEELDAFNDVSDRNSYLRAAGESSSSKSQKDFVNKILKVYNQKRDDSNSNNNNKNPTMLSNSSTDSMERQESRDSGFWSISKSSFESMKSLSINDNQYQQHYTKSKLTSMPSIDTPTSTTPTAPPTNTQQFQSSLDASKLKIHNWKKWKKEHTLRYSNSESQSSCITESFEENQTVDSLSVAKNMLKSKSLDSDHSVTTTATTKSNESQTTAAADKGMSNESIVSALSTNSLSSTATSHKRRGKLMRDMTIDDEHAIHVPDQKLDLNNNNNNKIQTANSTEPLNGVAKGGSCSSPPEKRTLFFYEKQMSIDETFLDDNNKDKRKSGGECLKKYGCNCYECLEQQQQQKNLNFNANLLAPTTVTNPTTTTNINQNLLLNNGRPPNIFTQSVSFDSYNYPYNFMYNTDQKTTKLHQQNPFIRSYTTSYDEQHKPDRRNDEFSSKTVVKTNLSPNFLNIATNASSFNTVNSATIPKTEPKIQQQQHAASNLQAEFLNAIAYNLHKSRAAANFNSFQTYLTNDLLNNMAAANNLSHNSNNKTALNQHNDMKPQSNDKSNSFNLKMTSSPSSSSEIDADSQKHYPFSLDMFTHHQHHSTNKLSKRLNQPKISAAESNKPHVCMCCQKKFARSDMLIRHSRLHSGLRPYKCNQCGQEFSRSDHLNTHQRTHTGEKPYTCPYPKCLYAACRKDMITRHLKVHNKNRSPSSSSSANLLLLDNQATTTPTAATANSPSSSPLSFSISVSSPPSYLASRSPQTNYFTDNDTASSDTTTTTTTPASGVVLDNLMAVARPTATTAPTNNFNNLKIPTIRIEES